MYAGRHVAGLGHAAWADIADYLVSAGYRAAACVGDWGAESVGRHAAVRELSSPYRCPAWLLPESSPKQTSCQTADKLSLEVFPEPPPGASLAEAAVQVSAMGGWIALRWMLLGSGVPCLLCCCAAGGHFTALLCHTFADALRSPTTQ